MHLLNDSTDIKLSARRLLLSLIILMSFIAHGCGDLYELEYEPYPIVTSNGDAISNEILDVNFYFQEDQVWCWAAVEEMILDYYGRYYSQREIVSGTFNYAYSTPATLPQMQYGLYKMGGLQSEYHMGPLNANQIWEQLNNGYPIIASYSNSFAGHVVVIYGIDTSNNLYIHDPFYGSAVVPIGASYYYGTQTGQPYVWSNSIINIYRPY